jgi:RNA polymerase sigma-70 factor (ECF subfamily)
MLPHMDAAYRLARWLLRDPQEAEDAVQDSYLKAYEAFDQYAGGSGAAWLLKIVRNTSLSMLRSRNSRGNIVVLKDLSGRDDAGRSPIAADSSPLPDRALIAKDEQEQLRLLLAELPEIYREVIVLRELEEMTYQQIADITGVPVGTVMSRLSRARSALRDAVRKSKARDEQNGV